MRPITETLLRTRGRLAAFALAAAAASPAYAGETRFSAYGTAHGDHQDTVRCPAGTALQGFTGRYGMWIDRIQLLCAPALPGGEFGQPVATGPEFGGEGGQRQDMYCPRGTYFSGAEYTKTLGDQQVANIKMRCTPVAAGRQASTIMFGQAGYRIETSGPGIANERFLTQNGLHYCPGGQVATGIDVNWGRHVNAVGLICNDVPHPAAVAPPPVPLAAPVPPAAPVKPIKSTARSGDPAAPVASWLGNWTLTMGGATYQLTMHDDPDNGANHLWGEFTTGNAQLNGTMIGAMTADKRWFEFTYEQPENNTSGGGKLLMLVNGTFAGSVKTNDDPPVEVNWRGVRR